MNGSCSLTCCRGKSGFPSEDYSVPHVRWNADDALGEIGAPAVERLVAALRECDLAVIAKVYPFFIVRAEPESEYVLDQALNAYGTKAMVADYLDCGNQALERTARKWAKGNGYSIVSIPRPEGGGVHWGSRC